MPTSKVTSKCQVTVPAEVRKKLGIREGDALVYELDEASTAVRVSRLRPFDAEWHRAISATLQDEWNSAEDDWAFGTLQRIHQAVPVNKQKA